MAEQVLSKFPPSSTFQKYCHVLQRDQASVRSWAEYVTVTASVTAQDDGLTSVQLITTKSCSSIQLL